MERVEVAVVGGGQAGLATSHELTLRGVDHVVLERGEIGQTWRDRWDSFCLVTPNWSVRLPEHPHEGDDPDSYLPRDEIRLLPGTLCGRSRGSRAPQRRGALHSSGSPGGGFVLETVRRDLQAARWFSPRARISVRTGRGEPTRRPIS